MNKEETREYYRIWNKNNRERVRNYGRKYDATNREERHTAHRLNYEPEKRRIRYLLNKERELKRNREWEVRNKERRAIKSLQYVRNHLPQYAAKQAARRALELMAQPQWIDRSAVAKFYVEPRRLTITTGVIHSVDHILPLEGKDFVGLHVPWNLRVITKSENSRKRNKRPCL